MDAALPSPMVPSEDAVVTGAAPRPKPKPKQKKKKMKRKPEESPFPEDSQSETAPSPCGGGDEDPPIGGVLHPKRGGAHLGLAFGHHWVCPDALAPHRALAQCLSSFKLEAGEGGMFVHALVVCTWTVQCCPLR